MRKNNLAPLTAFPDITNKMIEEFQNFTEFIEPSEFRNQLVNLYLQLIISDPEGIPVDFKNTTDNLYLFIEFLTRLQKAMDERGK